MNCKCYPNVPELAHAAQTGQGAKSSFQADLSTDEVAAHGCPHGSFESGGKCLCDQYGDVCTLDGSLDCPRGDDDTPDMFFPDCEGCTCVAATDICKGGGEVRKKVEGGFHCSCVFGELCTRGGTLSCPSPGESSWDPPHSTYPTDCEDCQCVKEDTVCPSGTTFEFGKCECGSGQVCTRDGKFADCGVEFQPAQFKPECIDCHCVGQVDEAVCPGSQSPNEGGDCSCDWGNYCSTDDGDSANCPSFFKEWVPSDQQHFHHWCKDCKCYPNSRTTAPPKAECPESAETLMPGWCFCKGTGEVFESSCGDCTCV